MERLPAWVPKADPTQLKAITVDSIVLYCKHLGSSGVSEHGAFSLVSSDGTLDQPIDKLSLEKLVEVGEALFFNGIKIAKDYAALERKDSPEALGLLSSGALAVMAGNVLFTYDAEVKTSLRSHMESIASKGEAPWYPGWDETQSVLREALSGPTKSVPACSTLE